MKFLDAFKDSTGFHYMVQLDDGTTRPFNYSLPVPYSTGRMITSTVPDPTGALEADPVDPNKQVPVMVEVTTPEFIQETEAEYTARIEQEIKAACTQIVNQPVPVQQPLASKGKPF